MSLVRVWTDVGARKPVALLAKIVEENGVIFTIRYLSESDDKIWRYEDELYEIDDDSIAERLGTDNEEDLGYQKIDGGFSRVDSDDDYTPSDEDEESDDEDEESFEDSDEEELDDDDESDCSEESIDE
jgi:ribonuclease E